MKLTVTKLNGYHNMTGPQYTFIEFKDVYNYEFRDGFLMIVQVDPVTTLKNKTTYIAIGDVKVLVAE